MKTFKVFNNNDLKSLAVTKEFKEKMQNGGFTETSKNPDLAIAIGGDGAFLRMIKTCKFSDKILYLGINTGTLGFAQELYPENIDLFIEKLKHEDYKTEYIGALETKITTDSLVEHFYSLNEIVIRESNLNTAHLNVKIDNELLENFGGDGLLIATSFGSSAYNLSFGGSLIYSELHALEITPIAPLNSKCYRSLINSVVLPEEKKISITPSSRSDDLIVTIDGINNCFNKVLKIETFMRKKKIKVLRLKESNYTKKVYEKFAKD